MYMLVFWRIVLECIFCGFVIIIRLFEGVYMDSYLSHSDDKRIVNDIDSLLSSGYSIYKACMILANNDKQLANKYSYRYRKLKKNGDYNIVTIKSHTKKLNDEDMVSLFMGIVGLIKKSTVYDIRSKYRIVLEDYKSRLNMAIAELKKKESLLIEVLSENERLRGKYINMNSLYNKIKGE